MNIDNDVSVASKLTEARIRKEVCEKIQRKADNQVEDEKVIEKTPTNAEIRKFWNAMNIACRFKKKKQYDYAQLISDLKLRIV